VTPPAIPAADAPGDPNALIAAALAATVGLLALLPAALLAAARLRGPLPRVADALHRLPFRSFLVGCLAGLAVVLLAAAGAAQPLFKIPALVAAVAATAMAFLGLVAEARSLGCRLRGRDPAGEGVEGGSVAIGWLVLAGTALAPLAGFLVLLYLALRATGAAVIGLAASEQRAG
jgi:hypothetical protein